MNSVCGCSTSSRRIAAAPPRCQEGSSARVFPRRYSSSLFHSSSRPPQPPPQPFSALVSPLRALEMLR